MQVRPEPRRREPGPIPRLYNILSQIDHAYRRRSEVGDIESIANWATRAVRVQFALLRLLSVHRYLNRPPGEAALQWEIID